MRARACHIGGSRAEIFFGGGGFEIGHGGRKIRKPQRQLRQHRPFYPAAAADKTVGRHGQQNVKQQGGQRRGEKQQAEGGVAEGKIRRRIQRAFRQKGIKKRACVGILPQRGGERGQVGGGKQDKGGVFFLSWIEPVRRERLSDGLKQFQAV